MILNLGPLEEQPEFLSAAEPSLQAPQYSMLNDFKILSFQIKKMFR